jgi:hypothetical protein
MSGHIDNIVDIVYLTSENAKFTLSGNGFLQLKANVKVPESGGLDIEKEKNEKKKEENEENKKQEIFFERVFLHRAFPFDNPLEYISVSGNFPKTEEELKKEREEREKKEKENAEKGEEKKDIPKENTTSLGELKEIGIIRNITVFTETERNYISNELQRKYFVPVIEFIHSVKEKYGYSYWDVNTAIGRIKFTVHDAHRNILKVTEDRILVADVNGNRYEITSLRGFDRNSLRKIELYL